VDLQTSDVWDFLHFRRTAPSVLTAGSDENIDIKGSAATIITMPLAVEVTPKNVIAIFATNLQTPSADKTASIHNNIARTWLNQHPQLPNCSQPARCIKRWIALQTDNSRYAPSCAHGTKHETGNHHK
jgi:hypothetical protein